MTGEDLAGRSTHDLLRLYSGVLHELLARGVTRTLNAPVGDIAETIVARAYGGTLAPNSEKSWDVLATDSRRLQVKSRVITERALTKPISFSVFRSWDFDAAVFVVLSAETYDVIGGFETGVDAIRSRASDVVWVGGMRITPTLQVLRSMPGAIDVTDRLHAALMALP